MATNHWIILFATLILIAGIVNDLKSQKVRNWLVLSLLSLALVANYVLLGTEGLKIAGLSALVALGCCLPLVFPKIMGAGDMKLLIAFSVLVTPMTVVWVILYSFIWGSVLGVLQIILKKEGLALVNNMKAIAAGKGKEIESSQLHKIPYTVALFFGWLTQLSLTGFGSYL